MNRAVYLCGGTIRDLILERPLPDIDLAVSGSAFELGRAWAEKASLRFVPLDPGHDTCRVVTNQGWIDLAGLRGPTIEADLWARDFTINAMALPLTGTQAQTGPIIDPCQGLSDLELKIIRFTSPGTLSEDPLRALRAFRFAATLDFYLHPDTRAAVRAVAPRLPAVAAERTLAELNLIFDSGATHRVLAPMESAGLITALFPELEPGRNLLQNPGHHLGVREHSIETVRQMDLLAIDPSPWFGDYLNDIRDYLKRPPSRRRLLWAALAHDLGKPRTRDVQERGGRPWATFYRHEIEGSGLWLDMARRLKTARADIAAVAKMVELHMRPWHLLGLEARGQLTARAINRMVLAAGDDLTGLFLLAVADALAGLGPGRTPDVEAKLVGLYGRALDHQRQMVAPALARPLLNGRQVMELLDIEQGPAVGRYLAALTDAQMEGRVTTEDQAREWLVDLYRSHRG